ncbi:MAG: hypothetical protein KDB82_09165 [Planctomycetes bacterium]|nr:hypothetical protein [Planctomycetota bacterium]
MKKWMAVLVCALLLAACGGGNNATSGSGNEGSACSAPELKGLEGAELAAMKAAVSVRDKLKDLKKRSEGADADAKKKLMEEFEGMEGEYHSMNDLIDKLEDAGKKKFETIKAEIKKLEKEVENALK